jgi:exonuclease SbcD
VKILCLGDVHLGAGTDYGAAAHGDGSRLDDQRKVLDRVLDIAREKDFHVMDHILVAGDVFHRRNPTPAEIEVWQEFVMDATNEFGDVVTVTGNHDVSNPDLTLALDVCPNGWAARAPEVVELNGFLRSGNRYDGPIRDGKDANALVSVAMLPWTPVSRLVAKMNGQVARDEVNALAADLLIEAARDLRAQARDDTRAILLTHWSISGAALPNGLPVDQLREPILPLTELVDLGYEAVIAGHIHRPAVLSENPLVLYTGSPAAVDFGEAHVGHGVWLLDMATPGNVTHEFIPIDDRRFITVDCDLTTERGLEFGLDETDAIAAAVATQLPIDDAVVRIRYKATPDQARRVDVAALKKLCMDAGASKVYSVQAAIERGERARVEGVDENLGELVAVDKWTDANEIPSGQAGRLIEITSRYLEEIAA